MCLVLRLGPSCANIIRVPCWCRFIKVTGTFIANIHRYVASKFCLFLHLWFDLIKLKEIGIYLAILVHNLLHLFSSSSRPLSFLCYLKGFCWLSFRGKQTLRHEYLYHVNVNLLPLLSNRILLYSILDVRMKILNILIMYIRV